MGWGRGVGGSVSSTIGLCLVQIKLSLGPRSQAEMASLPVSLHDLQDHTASLVMARVHKTGAPGDPLDEATAPDPLPLPLTLTVGASIPTAQGQYPC